MHPINTELFHYVRTAYANAHTAYMAGQMEEEEFFAAKKIFEAAKKNLMPSKGKAMRSIEKDLRAKYGQDYRTI